MNDPTQDIEPARAAECPDEWALRARHRPTQRRRIWMPVAAVVIVIGLIAGGATIAFVHGSRHLAALRNDNHATLSRVAVLTDQLAAATDERDRSLHAAAIARAALERARSAHERGASALSAQRADLASARRQAYASLLDATKRNAQLAALRDCLDGVSRALNRLSVGDVGGWQRTLRSVDPTCQRAQEPAV